MEQVKNIYETPESKVVRVQLKTRILSGSDNMIGRPDNYPGSGEGFEW